jgi:glycosyltransferase involved in cell wall biosynthesis
MPGAKIKVHHTGIDLESFRPVDRAAAKSALGVPGPLLVAVGGLLSRKGQDLAIEALRSVPGATLLLVGEGPDRGRLERLAHGLPVRFLGVRPHDELPGLLAAADVMVLPTASEGLANAWVEALACGTPVVTSNVGGAPEVIDDPAFGRLVRRDPAAIAAAVNELLAEPPAQDAVRKGVLRFGWERNGAGLEAHLAGLVR